MNVEQLQQLRDLLQLYYQQELYDPEHGQSTWDVLLNVDRTLNDADVREREGHAHSS